MKRYIAPLLFLTLCEVLAAACENPQPPPVVIPPVSSAGSTPDAACVSKPTVDEEEINLRTQSVKSMCDALTRSCKGFEDPDCQSFMDVYYTSIQTNRGPLPILHLSQPWTPMVDGWMSKLKPWQVFCMVKARTAREVRSCNTQIECLDLKTKKRT